MKMTPRLLYRLPVARRHRVAACIDMPGPPCWHAACGWCRAQSRATLTRRSHADAVSWLARHLRDEHGTTL